MIPSLRTVQALAKEAGVVGIALAVALVLGEMVFPSRDSTTRTALLGFGVGVALHVAFEMSKLNALYCEYGNACRTPAEAAPPADDDDDDDDDDDR